MVETQSGTPPSYGLAVYGALLRRTSQIKAFVYFDTNLNRSGRVPNWPLRAAQEDLGGLRAPVADPYFAPHWQAVTA